MSKIDSIRGIEILDSRGEPTIEVLLTTDNGHIGTASVPSGASKGEHEAKEMRDQDPHRYFGKGVLNAIKIVEELLQPLLIGKSVFDQEEIDALMISKDGTSDKSHLGSNTLLAVSMATARAAAAARRVPLYYYLGQEKKIELPIPLMNLINGGAHADNSLEFQEFMICPVGAPSFKESIRWGSEVFHSLKKNLKKRSHLVSVGDEGGFAPQISSHEEACSLLVESILSAGYKPGKDISIALDCAASHFYKEGSYLGYSFPDYLTYLKQLCRSYPIVSIEDPLDQNDWEHWPLLREQLPIQVVGDDLFVTHHLFLEKGIQYKAANAIVIKPNQIGTLTESMTTINRAKKEGYQLIISHRSGETNDTFIADLAVAVGAKYIKAGSVSRGERVGKYNRLLEIESQKLFYRDNLL